ncbi:hypothetical protein ABZ312_12255 [Streptomyces sp. NPDC006207]
MAASTAARWSSGRPRDHASARCRASSAVLSRRACARSSLCAWALPCSSRARLHADVLPPRALRPSQSRLGALGLRGVGCEALEPFQQGPSAGGPPGVLERVGGEAEPGVPGEQSEVVRGEFQSRPEGLLRLVVVVVLVLADVPEGQPAVEVGGRGVLPQPFPGGPAHRRVAARGVEVGAKAQVLVRRRHVSRP